MSRVLRPSFSQEIRSQLTEGKPGLDIPQPTYTPAPSSPAGIETIPTAVPDGNLATVTRIINGDTINIDIGGTTYRVRYISIGTPEGGGYFFSEVTQANRALVAGR